MTISSFLASRKSPGHHTTATQQLVVFRVQQERFALPIQVTQKVIPLAETYGASQETGTSLTHYQDQELLVIDLECRIFAEGTSQKALPSTRLRAFTQPSNSLEQQRYLLIIQNLHGEPVGLTLDSQPSLCRVPASAFAPIPPAYQAEGRIRCISAIVVTDPNTPPIFLLNLNQLLQPQSTPALEES